MGYFYRWQQKNYVEHEGCVQMNQLDIKQGLATILFAVAFVGGLLGLGVAYLWHEVYDSPTATDACLFGAHLQQCMSESSGQVAECAAVARELAQVTRSVARTADQCEAE